MLVNAFGYKLVIEESLKDSNLVTVSEQSRADYIAWTLMHQTCNQQVPVSITVLEAKHLEKIGYKQIAQAIGYYNYCKSRIGDLGSDNRSGVVIVFNELMEK